jgi:hypothetical protein
VDIVVHVCNPSYLGVEAKRTEFKTSPGKKLVRPYLKNKIKPKRAGSIAQVVEYLQA